MTWNLSEEDIREVLGEAYEAGWYGCLELKEQSVQGLLAKLEKKNLEATIVVSVGTSVDDPSFGMSQEFINVNGAISLHDRDAIWYTTIQT